MKTNIIACVLFLTTALCINDVQIRAATIYGRSSVDIGKGNGTSGALVNIQAGGMFTGFMGAGLDLAFSPHWGYEYKAKTKSGETDYLDYFSIAPQIHFVFMKSWPVNLSLGVSGGPGWIGKTPESEIDNGNREGGKDMILFVKGRAAINVRVWDPVNIFAGVNYGRVYRSQNIEYTNKQLSGFEISAGFSFLYDAAPGSNLPPESSQQK